MEEEEGRENEIQSRSYEFAIRMELIIQESEGITRILTLIVKTSRQ